MHVSAFIRFISLHQRKAGKYLHTAIVLRPASMFEAVNIKKNYLHMIYTNDLHFLPPKGAMGFSHNAASSPGTSCSVPATAAALWREICFFLWNQTKKNGFQI